MTIGDEVITPKNKIEKVIGVYPQGIVDIYRVTFQDGATVCCCGEHLWSVSGYSDKAETLTTIDIQSILELKVSVAVELTEPINFNKAIRLQLDPYLMGSLLNKQICDRHKTSNICDRWALINGLMDTHGLVSKDGEVSYSTSSERLAEDIRYVLRSLGCMVTITSHYDKENKKLYKLYIRSKTDSKLFFLSRKKERCKNNPTLKNKIVSVEKIKKDYATCIVISGEEKLFLTTNFIVTHNSHILTMIPLRYLDCPNYRATFIRRTMPQLMKSGNLFDKGKLIYGALPKKVRPRFLQGDRKIALFPHGPVLEYSYLANDKDLENYQGSEMTGFFIDEATQLRWEHIVYLFSRMRSNSKYPSRMIMSGNPDPDHEIRTLVDWWLDDDGFPDPNKQGKIRYFLMVNDEFVWSNSKKVLIEKHRTPFYEPQPLSFSAIFSTIYDNPEAIKANPGYVSFLEGLNKVDKARLLHGSWNARPESSNYFKRAWIKEIQTLPLLKYTVCRAWDKAATRPSDIIKSPDYTACCQMQKSSEGDYYITGNYHPEVYDSSSNTYGRFRENPGMRDSLILKQAIFDGRDCSVIFPIDPGASGKSEYQSSSKNLMSEGFIVRKDPAPSQNSKLKRFEPFSAACQNGFVYVVTSTFDKPTLDHFYKELESFDGKPSSSTKKDDVVDCTASAFNYLVARKNHRIVLRNQIQSPTIKESMGL